jgi:signal transduction histidine kinase
VTFPKPGLRPPDPLFVVIVALLCASTLVLYLQRRALQDLNQQRAVILRTSAEQRATAIAVEMRKIFDGPVQDVLLAVNPPILAADRPDLVASEYARGLREYPQVERFFLWSDLTDASVPSEVLFYGRENAQRSPRLGGPLDSFSRDAQTGRYILSQARLHARSKRIYAAFPLIASDARYDLFMRIFYRDATRTEYFAVRGFAVNVDSLRSHILPALYARRFAPLLVSDNGGPDLDLRILDETQQVVFGPALPVHRLSAVEPFVLQFYPVDELESRMAATIPPRLWRIVVSPHADDARTIASAWLQGYWFSGLTVILMLVALGFAVQSRRRAAQLSHMQADFVAHISHQLKTPAALLSAVGETMALQRAQSPEKLAQCVDIVQAESARLTSMIERVLEFYRISGGGRRYEVEAVNLASLVRETVDAFAGALAPSAYHISVIEDRTDPIVAADPAALEQVLINLLDNALKYSGDSRVVEVSVGTVARHAVMSVADRGIGIAADRRRQIFERFYRGEGGMLGRQGFGLGLAIAQELVAAHRGSIEVESTVGAGSTFRVRLPLHRAVREVRTTPVPSKEPV